MFSLVFIMGFLWLTRTIKTVLFWIYLWQLKDYHIGRFVDHFRTHKGKKIFINVVFSVKLVLLALLLTSNQVFGAVLYLLVILYIAEALLFLSKNYKKPVWTAKTKLLTIVSFGVVVSFLTVAIQQIVSESWFLVVILTADIITPLIVSAVVLCFQPAFVIARNAILQKATERMAQFPKVKVVAVTGSYGKTTTKEFLYTILSSKFSVLSTPEHKNSEMGISQTILEELQENHQIFIVEMGAYNRGGIKLLCDIVKPVLGIVTGVNEQHLATFGSMKNLLSAEGGEELAQHLRTKGTLVVNGDNKYCRALYKNFQGTKKIYSAYSDRMAVDVWAEYVEVGKEHLDFTAVSPSGELMHFRANVLGRHNIENLLGAITVAQQLGMTMEEISEACKNIKPAMAGISLTYGSSGIAIIDSSYSSNPDGVIADLDYLSIFEGKKVVVMPCLIELGKKSTHVHEEIGKKIAQVCDLAIITTKDKFREISEGFISQGIPGRKILFCENPKEIFNMITMMCKEGDAVLLEGRVPGELIRLLNEKQI